MECGVTVTHWLSVIAGQKVGHRYVLSKEQGTIGRGSSNAIQVFDAEVSRVHCRFHVTDNYLEIADLDSSNGTFVNGSPIARCELTTGDSVKVGTTVLKYEIHDAVPQQAVFENISDTDFTIHGKEPAKDSPSSLSYFPVNEKLFVENPSSESSDDGKSDSAQMVQIVSDMSFIYHASLVTSSKADRDQMLDSLIDLIFKWVAADRCCVMLRDGDKRKFSTQAVRSRGQQTNEDKLLISQSIVNYVRKNRVGILTSNALDDQRLSSKSSIKQIGIQEAICVPIKGRDQLLGLIYIDALAPAGSTKSERFNRDNLKLMIAIGLQIGFAIENERYFSKLLEQQQQATIGQTTASLSHHMKNVLQGVNGGAHLVESGFKNDDMELAKKGWEIVNRNQQQISRLVNDMLIVGQPYDPHLIEADLNEVITSVFEEIGPFLSQRNIQYEWNPGSDPALFRFDPRGIHWALYNLINSCAGACHGLSHGKILASVKRSDDGTVIISIADNGLPAKVKDAEDLFSPAKSKPDHRMNPVELAVSRKLVRGHAGEIEITHPESGGNLFTIRLPLEPLTANKAALSSRA